MRLSPHLVVLSAFLLLPAAGRAQFAEQNVNMVSGRSWPGGDPFLRQQNEPSIAVSTRNPLHLLAGANDYRSVDIPFNAPPRPDEEETGDAWLGVFKSKDGGNRWWSTLLDGYPQQTNTTSPLHGYQAGADPVVRSGANGMFYYAGIVLNRGNNPLGGVFVARFIDNNNTEVGDPIAYIDTNLIDKGTAGQFIDKPWIAVSPQPGAGQCTVSGQTFPAQTIYLAYTVFVGNNNNVRNKVMFTRSTDCGATWANPQKLSETFSVNQGVSIAAAANGTVYVAWRQFRNGKDPDAIVFAKSTDGGGKFGKGTVVTTITPFDQPTSSKSFRTNSYPTLVVDGMGRLYLAWSQRNANGDAEIVLSVSENGGGSWSPAVPVDPIAVGADPHYPRHGNQFMPSMIFAGGKLTLAWYDQREDHTMGVFAKKTYAESRVAVGNLALFEPQVVFWNFLADITPLAGLNLVRRHTLDVRVAQADPASAPSFTSVRVSRYRIGRFGPGPIQQLEINPPNLPMFAQGTKPFFGDYIDLATYVNGQSNARVRHVVWTDDRDVRPPVGNPADWTKYTPVHSAALGAKSTFDPTQTPPPCNQDFAASRNQNIYTTRVTDGLFAGSPGNTKPLGRIQRAFAVFVQNSSNSEGSFLLAIANQPVNGKASFLQFSDLFQTTVTIPAHSTATRTVFVTSSDPHAAVTVNISQLGGSLNTVVTLNGDPRNPDIGNPDIGNPDIGNAEVFNPDIGNPDIGNPDIGNPDIGNPDIGNPDIGNPDIGNPDIGNPDIGNPDIGNPDIGNPDIGNADLSNASVTDNNWSITNQGNTTGGYTVKLFKSGDLPPGVTTQLILNKVYDTTVSRNCELTLQRHVQVVSSINNPPFASPGDLSDPSLNDPSDKSATLWLNPGETGRITLRVIDPFHKGLTLDVRSIISPVAISHSANTCTNPPCENQTPAISLTILTTSLPDGTVGTPYSASLDAIGGVGTRIWTATGLPTGLSVSGASITGSPQTAGSYPVTITVTDSAPTPHQASRTLTLNVVAPARVITSVIPSTAAPNQMVTITATQLPDPSLVSARFNGVSGFVFQSPSTTSTIYARLPVDLSPGPGSVTLRSGDLSWPAFPITISSTPGQPVLQVVYGTTFTNAEVCPFAITGPTTSFYPGSTLAVSAFGVDTTGSDLRFQQSGQDDLSAGSSCAFSSDAIGLAPLFTTPGNLIPGPVQISIRTIVGGEPSPWSAPVTLTVLEPVR